MLGFSLDLNNYSVHISGGLPLLADGFVYLNTDDNEMLITDENEYIFGNE